MFGQMRTTQPITPGIQYRSNDAPLALKASTKRVAAWCLWSESLAIDVSGRCLTLEEQQHTATIDLGNYWDLYDLNFLFYLH